MRWTSRMFWFAALAAFAGLLLALPARADGKLLGTAVGPDGAPLKDVQVKLLPLREDLTTLQTKSNKKGKFTFGVIRPGTYRLVAFQEGMRISRIDVNIADQNNDSVWSHHGDVPYGTELPELAITGVTVVTYDLKFGPSVTGPGKYGTGEPMSTTDAIVKQIQAGQYDQALAEINRRLAEKPDSAAMQYLQAYALVSAGKNDQALVAADKTLELDPTFEGAHFLKGKILEAKGDKEGALGYFKEEAESAKTPQVLRDAYVAWAVTAEDLGKTDEARQALEKLLEVSQDKASVYRELADVYMKAGDREKAAEMLKKVAEEGGGNDPNVLFNLGAERFNAKDFQAAADYFTRAVTAKPDFAEAYLRLGYCKLNLGKTDEAANNLAKYLELKPEGADADTARQILQAIRGQQK